MSIIAVVICLAILILLIAYWDFNPFLAFVISSIAGGIMFSFIASQGAQTISFEQIPVSIQNGIGSALGPLVAIVCLGAMFGKLIADSGAAQKITTVLINVCGEKYITWALMMAGFIVGIPLFYNVGFVLLVPLVFAVAYQTRLPAVYLGIPLLASLSVTHGFLPPHPSPTALVPQFNADMGLTLLYGLIIAVPAMVLGGPIFARFLKKVHCTPLAMFTPDLIAEEKLPSTFNSFSTALLPVVLLTLATVAPLVLPVSTEFKGVVGLLGNPMIVMLISLAIASYSLSLMRGQKIAVLMQSYGAAIKDITPILLIIAGAGALKQIFVDSGVSNDIGAVLQNIPLNPLILGWLIALIIRICLGSATVAGLTAAGIVAPMVLSTASINPNLMVLAIGAGSLMCSHVNDSGFWMYKEYFNLSLRDTFRSWTLMETIVGVVGLIGVLILDAII